MPGTVAIWRMASVFFFGNGQLTQLVVEMATWGCSSSTAPDPTQAEWRSGVPATTTTPSGSPSSAATAGVTVPTTLAVARAAELAGRDAARPHQDRVVGQDVGAPVVGQPGPGHGGRRGGGPPVKRIDR